MRIVGIVAIDSTNGIGKNNKIPWRVPEDLRYFMKTTCQGQNPGIIMGRNTWESISGIYKPLPGRLNVILSRQKDFSVPEGVLHFTSLDEALTAMNERTDIARLFVIGGGVIFEEAIKHEACGRIYLTHIYKDFGCTVFFPQHEDDFAIVNESRVYAHKKISFSFCLYERV